MSSVAAGLQLNALQDYEGEIEVGLDLSRLAQWPLPAALPSHKGRVALLVRVRNGAEGLSAKDSVDLTRVHLDQYCFGDELDLVFTLQNNVLNFDGAAELIRKGGRVQLFCCRAEVQADGTGQVACRWDMLTVSAASAPRRPPLMSTINTDIEERLTRLESKGAMDDGRP